MRFSKEEVFELLKAYVGISIAFGILLWNSYQMDFGQAFLVSALTVGIGFVFHELAHKYLAQRFGVSAEFHAFMPFIAMAILMSFFGFVVAAPGAVFIRGNLSKNKEGWVSASGIIANMAAAVLFLALYFATRQGIAGSIGVYGAMINSWLAVFNLIPLGNFDGKKVLTWSKWFYAALVCFTLCLFGVLMFLKIV